MPFLTLTSSEKLRIILLAMGTSIASSTGSELIKVGGVESMNKSFFGFKIFF
ncbi:hypothetical protein EU95_0004 [Prochlorococcus marinus str. MIT 9201]|uniref:Uncharacterized protein n=1 Tax=Prochlorococcus marinus str. MIT 9201 TaxID=93057 RepID=A0A0A2AD41_PROMR|nr:hypothetical protein EU95_0004 [Prochlorococcus marinus str. MIT 9201]